MAKRKLFIYLDIDQTLDGNKDHNYLVNICEDDKLTDRQKLTRILTLFWSYYDVVDWDDLQRNNLGSLIPYRAIAKFKNLYYKLKEDYEVYVVGVSAWFGSPKDNRTICDVLGIDFRDFIPGDNLGAGGGPREDTVAEIVCSTPEAVHLILDDQEYSSDLERFRIAPTREWGYKDNQWVELLKLANNQY